MKLLFHENLSRRLVPQLPDRYPGARHPRNFGLCERPDSEIWDHAKKAGFTLVTTDSDFFEFATTHGPPPKVIWLKKWRHPTKDAEAILRGDAVRIHEFARDQDASVLVLERHE